jgi:hypothetical protein
MNLHALYIILIFVAGGLGYYLGTLPQPSTTPSDLQAARDSLKAQMLQSQTREAWYRAELTKDSAAIASLEAKEYSHQVKIHRYEKRLQDLRNIPVAHPDSFLIRRYPGPAPGGPVAPGDGGAGTLAEGSYGQLAGGEGQPDIDIAASQYHTLEHDILAEWRPD